MADYEGLWHPSRMPRLLVLVCLVLSIWIADTGAFSATTTTGNVNKAGGGRNKAQANWKAPTNLEGTEASQIIRPGETFRDTGPGEISVTSCNVLAPFYNSLSLEEDEFREAFADADREDRFPLAIEMAKQSNPDILLLQEVEGGPIHEPRLKKLLEFPIFTPTQIASGYDSYLWAPLLPESELDTVGLCIAWRSNRHRLVKSNCYYRGMVCQFTEVLDDQSSTAPGTFAIANIHLPARPDNLLGRLFAMSRTIHKLGTYDVRRRLSPLDGLLMVGGDWNCDHKSFPAHLLRTGRTKFGHIREGEHEATVYKSVANRMKHGYRFQDVYRTLRDDYAPVTVSLHGREPACMDHLFCAQRDEFPRRRPPAEPSADSSERTESVSGASDPNNSTSNETSITGAAEDKATPTPPTVNGSSDHNDEEARSTSSGRSRRNKTNVRRKHMQVEAVLSTVAGPEDKQRLKTILQGLPNVEAGFPSDHIPIGALFVPHPEFQPLDTTFDEDEDDNDDDDEADIV